MSFILLVEQAAPQTPSANQVVFYAKSDGRMYSKDDIGTESNLQSIFVATTRMLFQQTSAPSGWTKESAAAYNDAAPRFTTGAVTTGGAVAFSTNFNAALATASDGSGTSGGYTLATADIPSHNHTQDAHTHSVSVGTGSKGAVTAVASNATYTGTTSISGAALTTTATNQATGGGGSHSHSTPAHSHVIASLNLKFIDTIIASKD